MKSYQQPVNIVKNMLYIWWRTRDLIQDVDRKCGYVDKQCGYLVRKVRISCEYLNHYRRKTKRKIFKAGN